MSEHTPGPWRLHDMEANTIVAGRPGGEVCNTLNGFGDQRANAEFIIRACNSYDDMLATLNRIVDEPNNTLSDAKALREIVRVARIAIVKATGVQ